MSESNKIGILTCPLCGEHNCPIFYGFTLIYPCFDFPKRLNIGLIYMCSQNDNKISSIDLSRYLEMIEFNSKFKNFLEIEKNNNISLKEVNESEIDEDIKKISNNINDIINKFKEIINSNKLFINSYINENKQIKDIIKYFLVRYNELNDELFSFLKIFLLNIKVHKGNNLKLSFLYMSRAVDFFPILTNNRLYLNKKLIEEIIQTKNIINLPFLAKLQKVEIPSRGKETLIGHNLPIVGLMQMRNGLILSGSYGFLKIWKKNKNINNDNYSFFELLNSVNLENRLIQSFIELEDNIIAFSKGIQIVEAKIDKNGPEYYKEIFQYQPEEHSLDSLTSINNNKHLVGAFYQKMYVYERNNPSPIYTLQYHEFFVKRLISIPAINLFCSAGTDHKIIVYNSENFEFFNVFNFEESHIVGLCNYNLTDFCASTMGGKIWYFKWNEQNNNHEMIGPINAHNSEIYGITQLKNGNVASVSRDSFIKFWDIKNLICLFKINFGANDIVIQLKDGRLCCASHNHLITIFNNLPDKNNYNFFSLDD